MEKQVQSISLEDMVLRIKNDIDKSVMKLMDIIDKQGALIQQLAPKPEVPVEETPEEEK